MIKILWDGTPKAYADIKMQQVDSMFRVSLFDGGILVTLKDGDGGCLFIKKGEYFTLEKGEFPKRIKSKNTMTKQQKKENEIILNFINSVYHFNDASATHTAVVEKLNELTAQLYRPQTKTDND